MRAAQKLRSWIVVDWPKPASMPTSTSMARISKGCFFLTVLPPSPCNTTGTAQPPLHDWVTSMLMSIAGPKCFKGLLSLYAWLMAFKKPPKGARWRPMALGTYLNSKGSEIPRGLKGAPSKALGATMVVPGPSGHLPVLINRLSVGQLYISGLYLCFQAQSAPIASK